MKDKVARYDVDCLKARVKNLEDLANDLAEIVAREHNYKLDDDCWRIAAFDKTTRTVFNRVDTP